MSSQGRKPDDGDADGSPVSRLAREMQFLQNQTGKSLKELETEVHASDSSLSRYTTGRAIPPWSVVERLSTLAGRDAERLRPLWETAKLVRRSGAPNEPDTASQPSASQTPVSQPSVSQTSVSQPPGELVAGRSRRRLVAAFAATALLFGGGGVLVGRHFGTRVVTVKPTEDSACVTWPWPGNAGQEVTAAVHPQAADHTPTIELMYGKSTDGHNAAWARITGASFGDRVWMDVSTDNAKSWTQCGPFPVTTSTGTSRAHDVAENELFRACGDVPRPAPNARGEICTDYW